MQNERTKNEVDVIHYEPLHDKVVLMSADKFLNSGKENLDALNLEKDSLKKSDLAPLEKKQKLQEIEKKIYVCRENILKNMAYKEERLAVGYDAAIRHNLEKLYILKARLEVIQSDKIANSGLIDAKEIAIRASELQESIEMYENATQPLIEKYDVHKAQEHHFEKAVWQKRREGEMSKMYGDGWKEDINYIRMQTKNAEHRLNDIVKDIRLTKWFIKDNEEGAAPILNNLIALESLLHSDDHNINKGVVMAKQEKVEGRYAQILQLRAQFAKRLDRENKSLTKAQNDFRKCSAQQMKHEAAEHAQQMKHEAAEQAVGNTFSNIADMLEDARLVKSDKMHGASMNSVAQGKKAYVSQSISGIGAKLGAAKDALKGFAGKVKNVISK